MTTTQTPKENRVFPVINADEGISESLPDAVNSCLGQYFNNLGGMTPAPGLHGKIIEQVEKPLIEHVLRYARGNQIRAAKILGINRNTLRKKITELEIIIPKNSNVH
ncbi:MAG: hypothetical protein OSB62_03630 [Alphaproteobacteria bacterium]|jgi:two-component system nitrogen regulation response regulator GlnG|nr:hypothetical protein [Alphaproteobacteria bacterium]